MAQRRIALLVCACAIAIALATSAHAQQGETKEKPQQPRVLEWFNLEFGMAPASVSLWFGAHTWYKNKYLVGIRGGARQSIFERDLDGDGTIDFAKSLNNNPLHFEVQADIGIPLTSRHGWRAYGTGLRKQIRTPNGTRTIWAGGTNVPDVTELSLATGARVAVGSDEIQVGLPIGLRYSYRVLTRGKRFREWWVSARLLMFVPSFRPGFDAEFAYMLGPFGVSVFFEYFPQIHDDGAGPPACGLAPQTCTPTVPLTVFNRIPNEGMVLGGLRLRMTKSF